MKNEWWLVAVCVWGVIVDVCVWGWGGVIVAVCVCVWEGGNRGCVCGV